MRWPERTQKERFFEKVEQPASGAACWLWIASKCRAGYGWFALNGKRDTVMGSHRAAWLLFRGEIPDGLQVLHKCDNPGCVNPEHLFLGTHTDNVHDKMRKGRHAYSHRTHCRHGHELSGENLYVQPNGARVCRECSRVKERMLLERKNPDAVRRSVRRSDFGRRTAPEREVRRWDSVS